MSQNGYCAIFPALISIGPNKLRGGGGGSEKNQKIDNSVFVDKILSYRPNIF